MKESRFVMARMPFWIAVCGLPLLAGCDKTFALDDGVPKTPPAVVITQRAAPAPGPVALRNTGTYPTFAPTLTAAAEQIDDEEYHKAEPRLAALARLRRNGSISEAEYNRRVSEYRRLAADHGRNAESEIAR